MERYGVISIPATLTYVRRLRLDIAVYVVCERRVKRYVWTTYVIQQPELRCAEIVDGKL